MHILFVILKTPEQLYDSTMFARSVFMEVGTFELIVGLRYLPLHMSVREPHCGSFFIFFILTQKIISARTIQLFVGLLKILEKWFFPPSIFDKTALLHSSSHVIPFHYVFLKEDYQREAAVQD